MNNPIALDDATDEHFMRRALELAKKGEGAVEPNPMVGCVIARDGSVLGEGYHRRFGGDHAEVEAIRSSGTSRLENATAYVSLEPCCHHGKTPPCSEALIQAGVGRVVIAMEDPFPKVAGGGVNHLKNAGLEVTTNVLRDHAVKLNSPYLKRVIHGKPWIIAKWAMTADGKIATHTGDSQWITNEESRQDVHRTRARVDGVLTGMGTVRSDNPTLNARLVGQGVNAPRTAERIVFCQSTLPNASSNLMRTAKDIPLQLFTSPVIQEIEIQEAEKMGATIHRIQETESTGFIDSALQSLGQQEMTNVLVEAGGELLGSLSDAGSIDEIHVYLGSMVVGNQEALSPLGGKGSSEIQHATRLQLEEVKTFGDNIKLTYRV